ncbi:START domain-containing protein 10-like [Styela clava]|uniref:START domain-containing protein 10-like n=1 Tax=Styela clava TaxID=7725 RepID=UPI001939DD75|nr:START domain-containing protein 10-like [Styela clava]
MDDEDLVLPADDKSFEEFKRLCREEDQWMECYNKKGIRVCTKPEGNSNIKLMRAKTIFTDVRASTVFDVVHDTDYRREWDKDMIDIYDICKLCVNNTVGYYAVKCPTPIKNRDCVFLCSWIAYPNIRDPKEYIMINKSVTHKDHPPKSNIVRAISIVTGYLIRPLGEFKTEFTYLTQFDPRGSLPKWVVNTITQLFTPKVIHRIHKASKRYPAWKSKHNENLKPWLWPEQNRLPQADLSKLSAKVEKVDVIDETNIKCADNIQSINNNDDSTLNSDSESDDINKKEMSLAKSKKKSAKAKGKVQANGNGV